MKKTLHKIHLILSYIIAALIVINCSKCLPLEKINLSEAGNSIQKITLNLLTNSIDVKSSTRPENSKLTTYSESTSKEYQEEVPYENTVQSVQILIFDKNTGELCLYHDNDKKLKAELKVYSGKKHIWAIINGPDCKQIRTENELKKITIYLDKHNNKSSSSFVMSGFLSCDIKNNPNLNIKLDRYVSRIVLVGIENNLSSDNFPEITINRILLTNVAANQTIGAEYSSNIFFNKQGRKDENTAIHKNIIDGISYQASCPELTYKNIEYKLQSGKSYIPDSDKLPIFYSYQNNSTITPNGLSADYPLTGEKTMLSIACTIPGLGLRYYNVILNSLERNTSYSVFLKIKSTGDDDPNLPTTKCDWTFSVSTEQWVENKVIEHVI